MRRPRGAARWVPPALVAGNLALFLLSSSLVTSGAVSVSHHWLFPFHEAVLLALAFAALPGGVPVRTTSSLSLLVLGIAAARWETVWLSRHGFHFALTFALAAALHGKLGLAPRTPWRGFNLGWALFSLAVAAASLAAALGRGLWWGLADYR